MMYSKLSGMTHQSFYVYEKQQHSRCLFVYIYEERQVLEVKN